MWDSNSPLQLLNSMPEKLEDEHLEKLQLLFEADKYKNQLINGVDLCGTGMYAPFCFECNKEGKYPCAVAYINSKKAEGMNLEIVGSEEQSNNDGAADDAVGDTISDVSVPQDEPDKNSEKTKIRIAIARKKIL